jgi:DNA-binding FadR family transcriptional regulator
MSDLIETRVALERVSAASAARFASRSTLASLAAVLAEMDEAATVEIFNPLDTLFHVLVARAGHNDLVADLTVAIREAVRRPILTSSLRMDDWPTFRLSLVHEHTGILDAITSGSPGRAADLMEEHIRAAYQALNDVGMEDDFAATTEV